MTVPKVLWLSLLPLAWAGVLQFQSELPNDVTLEPDAYRTATELITIKGFPCENHYVTTEDGYILNILRIPYGRKQNGARDRPLNANTTTTALPPRPVVFLQHGLLGCCTNFLTNRVDQSLAYLLADAGADVWVGNSRGTYYSLNHTSLSPDQREFWEFSWDEMAKYDLAASVKFIISTTGVDQISYVGHSQGTAIAFAGLSEDQGLAKYVKQVVALAPIARLGHIKSPIRLLAPFTKEIAVFFSIFGHGQFLLENDPLRLLQGNLCDKWRAELCANALFLVAGFDEKATNMSRIPVYTAHNPAGTSVQNIVHYGQSVVSDKFQKYDYGSPEANTKHYGQPTPPLYQPKNLNVPVAIFRGGQDWLSDDTDDEWLLSQLPNVILDDRIPQYAHLDFIWAIDSPRFVATKVIDLVMGKR